MRPYLERRLEIALSDLKSLEKEFAEEEPVKGIYLNQTALFQLKVFILELRNEIEELTLTKSVTDFINSSMRQY